MVNFALRRLSCATLSVSHVRYCAQIPILRYHITTTLILAWFVEHAPICLCLYIEKVPTIYCCLVQGKYISLLFLQLLCNLFFSLSNVVVIYAAPIGPRWWWRKGFVYWCRGNIQAAKTSPDSRQVIWQLKFICFTTIYTWTIKQ
jgi:hypothetical protein